MATIILTIPNPVANRVADAICARYMYQDTLPNGSPNPQTKNDFVKAWLINQLKSEVKIHEQVIASGTASTAAGLDVDSNINIT